MEGVSTVINLAGRAHVLAETAKDPEAEFIRVNRDGAVHLFEAARTAGVHGFLHMSSIHAVAVRSRPGRPIGDADPPVPESAYARSRAAADADLTTLAGNGGPALVILRPPLICGPGAKGNLDRLLRLASKPVPLPFRAVRNRRTLLSVDNLVTAIGAVLARWEREPVSGTFVLADPEALSTGDIIAAMRKGLGMEPALFSIPLPLLDLALRLAGRARLHEQLLGDFEIDADRFGAIFGWSPAVSTRACLAAMALAFVECSAARAIEHAVVERNDFAANPRV